VVWKQKRDQTIGDFYYARSDDSGITWSTPSLITATDVDPLKDQTNQRIVTTLNGNIYVARIQNELSATIFPVLVHRSTDDGQTWETCGAPFTDEESFILGTFIADRNNGIYLVRYINADPTASPQTYNYDIQLAYSSTDCNSWVTSTILRHISDATEIQPLEQFMPQLAIFEDGVNRKLFISYFEANSNELYTSLTSPVSLLFTTSSSAGGPWSTPVVVASDIALHLFFAAIVPTLAVDRQGHLTIAWGDYRNTNMDMYATSSDDFGATWSAELTKVNDSDEAVTVTVQWLPSIGPVGYGATALVWLDNRNGVNEYYYTRGLYSGTAQEWLENLPLIRESERHFELNTAQIYKPLIATDSRGNSLFIWSDKFNGNFDIFVLPLH
jgi:hypothetical protein